MQELYIKYFKSLKFSKKNYCTVIDQNTDRQIKMVKVRICYTEFDDMKVSCLLSRKRRHNVNILLKNITISKIILRGEKKNYP